MIKKLKDNLDLKLLAFLAALLLWLVVVNIDNPATPKTFTNIPVTVENAQILTEQQKTYQIVDGTQNVSVTVTAKRRALSEIEDEDIVVTADIKELSLDSQIPLKVTINGFEEEYVAVTNPRNLQVQIEENISKTLYITPASTGNVRDGFVLGNLEATPETVTINGPESLVNRISKAVAEVDVTGLAQDTELEANLIFYDANNGIIDQSRLGNDLGNFGVTVAVTLYETKTVPIQLDASNIKAADGYQISSIKLTPEEIEITGPEEALEEIENIRVSAQELEEKEIDSKTETTIDLTEYLPENIQLADTMANTVVVSVSVERNGTRNFELAVGSITVRNLDEDLRMSYSVTDNLEVHVKGSADLLDEINIGRAASVDLKEYTKAGTYTVPVEIELPEGCSLEGTVEVEIILEEKENGG